LDVFISAVYMALQRQKGEVAKILFLCLLPLAHKSAVCDRKHYLKIRLKITGIEVAGLFINQSPITPTNDLKLQPDKVIDVKWLSKTEICDLQKNGKLHPLIDYLDCI